MSAPLARRIDDIAPFHVMELIARTRELEAAGRDIVHLEVGEPDFDTPPAVIAAAQDYLSRGAVKYTHALGIPELRRAIAGFYRDRFDVVVDPARIIVTAGASGALQLALGVLVEAGAKWLLPDPGYPCNRHFVRLFEGQPVALPVGADAGFQPTAAQVDGAWQPGVQGIVLATPSNPTGTVLSVYELARIFDVVRSHAGAIVVDEIYQGLVYGANVGTALSIADDVFVVNSFSQYFGMTGWRLGWLVAPASHVRAVEKLAQNLFICASAVAQHAALAAFTPETTACLEERRAQFAQRRDLLVDGLRKIGLHVPVTPTGAFYVWADVSAFSDDSQAFCRELLERHGIAATPGIDFGSHQPERFVRFAYTTSMERLREGLRRLREAVAG